MTTLRSAAQTATTEHPTGTAVVGAGAATIVVLEWLIPSMPAAVAVAIVTLIGAAVSWATPRFDARRQLAHNDPPHGNTGPDMEDPA
jgi:hypothetical protein